MALKNSQRTYKHQVLHEMRETGLLDTQIYPRIKEDKASVKKNEIAAAARPFPAKQEDIKYPEPAIKSGNPLYMTGNMTYGN